jgi:hypothetical protein
LNLIILKNNWHTIIKIYHLNKKKFNTVKIILISYTFTLYHILQLSPNVGAGEESGEEEGGGGDELPHQQENPQLNTSSSQVATATTAAGVATAAGGSTAAEAGGEARPRLIINIMSGWNDEKSVVMRQEEVDPGEEHDSFHDILGAGAPVPPVILRHPRVPPLHGKPGRFS